MIAQKKKKKEEIKKLEIKKRHETRILHKRVKINNEMIIHKPILLY